MGLVSQAMESGRLMTYLVGVDGWQIGNENKSRTELELYTRRMTLGLATALLSLLALLGACAREAEDVVPVKVAATAPVPEQQLFDYRMIESTAGVKQWVLQSAEMQKFPGQRDMILSDVHMDFFRAGEHFSVLDADSGRVNTQSRDVHTWGQVVVVTDDGRRLEAEELSFSNETGLIYNDVFNRFTRATDVMTGIGLEATPDLEYIELKRDVKAEVEDSSELADPKGDGQASEGGQQ